MEVISVRVRRTRRLTRESFEAKLGRMIDRVADKPATASAISRTLRTVCMRIRQMTQSIIYNKFDISSERLTESPHSFAAFVKAWSR